MIEPVKKFKNTHMFLSTDVGNLITLIIVCDDEVILTMGRNNPKYTELLQHFTEKSIIVYAIGIKKNTTNHLRVIALLKDYYQCSLKYAKTKFDNL